MAEEQQHSVGGYLALPEGGRGPGVLVLHAWWGLNATVRGVCERLAGAGFVAYAPDMYRGHVATTIEEAQAAADGLESYVEDIWAGLAAATQFLRSYTGGGIGVVGYSLGAYFALGLAGRAAEDVRGVVLYYGTGEGDHKAARAAYLGHFAAADPYEPEESVTWLENELREAGRDVRFFSYAETGHWFSEPDREDAYDHEAAELAWGRSVGFLRKILGG